MIVLLLPLALAQADEAMIIEAERSVEEARTVLDAAIMEQGYLRPLTIGAHSRYIHPKLWRPRVIVYEEGLVDVRAWRATPMMFVPAGSTSQFSLDTPQSLSISDSLSNEPLSERGVSGTWGSGRTKRRMQSDVWDTIGADMVHWQDAIRARERLYREEELRERMHAAWDDVASAPAERRQAVAAMWLNTADSTDGERVRAMIEVFIDEVIQTSAHPFTADEVDRANAQRPAERALAPVSVE